MAKKWTLSLMTIAIFVSAVLGRYMVTHIAPADPRRAQLAARLAPELTVPARLPAEIEDADMLEAWVRLYNHTEPITLWDGSTTTGRALAQALVEQGIPVVWDDQHVCQVSCSVRYCQGDGTCSYDDREPGTEPIYVNRLFAGDIPSLVLVLAHEMFHRTQPFGAAPNTRFEEYWAFRLEAQLAPESAIHFSGFNPLMPNDLDAWCHANGLDGYLTLPPYPAGVRSVMEVTR